MSKRERFKNTSVSLCVPIGGVWVGGGEGGGVGGWGLWS